MLRLSLLIECLPFVSGFSNIIVILAETHPILGIALPQGSLSDQFFAIRIHRIKTNNQLFSHLT